MKKYEYKVTNFEANVSSSSDNVAAEVSGQVESLFEDYAAEGWELLGQYKFMVNYDAGCLGNILANFNMGDGDSSEVINTLVFRREV